MISEFMKTVLIWEGKHSSKNQDIAWMLIFDQKQKIPAKLEPA